MTDLTTACSALPRGLRQGDTTRPARGRNFVHTIARMMSWIWVQRRRRVIIRALDKVDDHLLRDVGIERHGIEDFVDTLLKQWR